MISGVPPGMMNDNGNTGSQDKSIGDPHISSNSSSSGHDSRQDNYVSPVVARREQKAIARTRCCVLLVLFLAVTAVATTAVMLINQDEQDDFETEFENSAYEIYAVAREATESTMEFLSGFSLTLTSYAAATNSSWPYVTVPHWPARVKWLSESTGANIFVIAPVVEAEERQKWEAYTREKAAEWYQEEISLGNLDMPLEEAMNLTATEIFIESPAVSSERPVATGPDPSLPAWQHYPIKRFLGYTNFDLMYSNDHAFAEAIQLGVATHEPVISFIAIGGHGESQIVQPIFENVYGESNMAGIIWASIDWLSYFQNILTEAGSTEVIVVMRSTCGQEAVTYKVNGPTAIFVAEGDVHDTGYDDMEIKVPFIAKGYDETRVPDGICTPEIWLHMYPTKKMEDSFHTNAAAVYTSIIVLIFAFTTSVLGLYDYFVKRRQEKFMKRVIEQDKIVSNVFPTAIRDRLYGNEDGSDNVKAANLTSGFGGMDNELASAPLAELFPSVTVIFADISGFTAWASAREPPQVFQLLESIYGAFDKLAYRHDVFKVETVGDCYVAVAGLPEPTNDHPVAAAKFARAILRKMTEMTYKLEVTLGPDTTDLQLRVGLNSGQVTAGVLRGERARFQLFGDTVNTAGRMESTGKSGYIQLSPATAELLMEHGKSTWIEPRSDRVKVKGKGEIQTYWLLAKEATSQDDHKSPSARVYKKIESADSEEQLELEGDAPDVLGSGKMSKTDRLVAWNVEVLSALLQQIVAARDESSVHTIKPLSKDESQIGKDSRTVLDEFQPIIELKRFDAGDLKKRRDPSQIDLGLAKGQLTDLITTLAGMYRNNPFHNFEHASHVTASVRKLLTRIVSVDDPGLKLSTHVGSKEMNLADLAGHSYGITSDPLTQFAVVLSAVIHDADHPGVPNVQLVEENTRNAQIYKKSIAEQNSVDLAWDVLMSPEYSDLRKCIYSTKEELGRFRQLLVNTVMATDIADKELQALRKSRWETAFSGTIEKNEAAVETENRKATIVIEHLIQASDVAHTMQHWHVFKRWNERLFMEVYSAYQAGRAASDPSLGWYKGEIGFFDFYVIPLAKKLDSCGVFGVSSDEYLSYAKANRDEWVREGEQIVEEYVRKYKALTLVRPMGE